MFVFFHVNNLDAQMWKKLEAIIVEPDYYQRCKPVTINSGFECPCFYLLPYVSGTKGLDYLKKFTSYLGDVCKSKYVCNSESYAPSVIFYNQYYAVKNDVYVVGYNNKLAGQENRKEVVIPVQNVPQQVQIVQKVIEQTANDPTPGPSEKPEVLQCPNDVPYRFDVIKYASADEIKNKALVNCKNNNSFIHYACVYDSSLGLKKTIAEYEQVSSSMKVAAGRKICASVGDPHYLPFSGKQFNVFGFEGRRLLYSKGDLTVSTSISFNAEKRGVNKFVEVVYQNNKFTLNAPVDRVFQHPTFNGFVITWKNVNDHMRKYRFKAGSARITIEVNDRNFLNVYVRVPEADTTNCKGDCCVDPANAPSEMKFQGDPLSVVFPSPCQRKKESVALCLKKFPSSFKSQFDCVLDYASGN